MWKRQFTKTWKCIKHENDLPLRMRNTIFGLRIGSRGTPWNWKSAQPGGSENAKCRKVPFIWHFGVFEVFDFFHFFTFCFSLFHFFLFFTFWLLLIFSLFAFSDFYCFLCFWWFCRFHVFLLFFVIFQLSEFQGKDKPLFWPLLPTIVHSHGKHLERVIS